MKHSKGVKLAAAWLPLAAMVFAIAAGCNKQTQHAPDVWAMVNGKEIKREEVDKYYRTRVNPEGQEPSQEESLSQKLNVLDELINNEILLEKAKKLNLSQRRRSRRQVHRIEEPVHRGRISAAAERSGHDCGGSEAGAAAAALDSEIVEP